MSALLVWSCVWLTVSHISPLFVSRFLFNLASQTLWPSLARSISSILLIQRRLLGIGLECTCAVTAHIISMWTCSLKYYAIQWIWSGRSDVLYVHYHHIYTIRAWVYHYVGLAQAGSVGWFLGILLLVYFSLYQYLLSNAFGWNGWMNDLTKDWVKCMWGSLKFGCRMLVWDAYKCHITVEVRRCVNTQTNTDVSVIPGGLTHYFQPADVSWNKSFRTAYKEQYSQWMATGPKFYTAAGNVRPQQSAVPPVGKGVLGGTSSWTHPEVLLCVWNFSEHRPTGRNSLP